MPKPMKPNARRQRYGRWLSKAATLLKDNGESMTANSLLNTLPDNQFSPTSANSAAQKMRKDKRFGSFEDYTTDISGYTYLTRFFFYDYKGGEALEE